MKRIFINKMGQAGDTIVEVLIAMAVLSAILGGAYISANQSLNNSRQAQERGEAAKVANSQLEQIKAYAKDPVKHGLMFDPNKIFCIDSAGNVKDIPGFPAYDPPDNSPLPENDNWNNNSFPTECTFQGLYHASIRYKYPGADSLFTIAIRWDRFGGKKDEMRMLYRLQK